MIPLRHSGQLYIELGTQSWQKVWPQFSSMVGRNKTSLQIGHSISDLSRSTSTKSTEPSSDSPSMNELTFISNHPVSFFIYRTSWNKTQQSNLRTQKRKMRFPYYTWCLGKFRTASNLSLMLSCVPRGNTTGCGRVLFWVCSPIWFALTIAGVLLGFVNDIVFGLLWLFFCCGGTCKGSDCEAGTRKAGSDDDDAIMTSAEPCCSSSWWAQLRDNAPDCCCNNGGCFSDV